MTATLLRVVLAYMTIRLSLPRPLAVATVSEALVNFPGIREVVFCCFSGHHLTVYEQALAGLKA